jgi:hypothetical protein
LLYPTAIICPDLSWHVSYIARFSTNPTEEQLSLLKRMLRYYKGTSTLGIKYQRTDAKLNNTSNVGLVGYSDSAFGDNVQRKSSASYVFKMAGGVKSYRQRLVTLSSTKSEYIALTYAAKEACWQLEVPADTDRRGRPAHERSDREKAEAIVPKLRHLLELAQASMAEAQQEQKRQANGNRREAPQLRVGDKVWLKLGKQFATGRKSKKLDWRSAKYTVTEVIDTHTVRLNTPPGPHNVFHVDRLRLASSDPLPSQLRDDDQPLPIQVDNDGADMWEVEDIVAEVCRRRGRGIRWWYEVKWKGYHLPTMEPMENLTNTEAKIRWEQFTVPYRDPNTRLLPAGFRRGSNQTHPDVSGKEGVM